jgi:hypothetical protein
MNHNPATRMLTCLFGLLCVNLAVSRTGLLVARTKKDTCGKNYCENDHCSFHGKLFLSITEFYKYRIYLKRKKLPHLPKIQLPGKCFTNGCDLLMIHESLIL